MARRKIRREIKYPAFHSAQNHIYHGIRNNRRVVVRAGRRFGKTTMLEVCACDWAVHGLKVGWFGPDWRRIRPSYSRILRTIAPLVTFKSKTEGMIETETGGQVEFWSLDDEDAGRSRDYDKVIIDEGSLVAKGLADTWDQAIRPTLLDRGGTAVMAGTPKGIDPDNFFHEACTNKDLGWIEYHAPTRLNPTLDPNEVANLVKEYPALVYQQEFLADFVDWSGTAFFNAEHLLVDGAGVPYPNGCDWIVATVDTATKTGREHDGTGVVFWAFDTIGKYPLVILDWDAVQISGDLLQNWVPGVLARCQELAKQCQARQGVSGLWIEDKNSGSVLLQHCARRGLPAFPIDSKLTAVGKEERALAVSPHVHQQLVKFSAFAHEKVTTYKQQARNHLWTQVTNFRMGTKDQRAEDDLLDCFTYGISINLGDAEGY